jgi:hypothetical protein
VFVIGGVIVREECQLDVVKRFLTLKRSSNPNRFAGAQLSDVIRGEVKGNDLRTDIRSESRNRRRAATHFLDETLKLLSDFNCRLIARVIVKKEDEKYRDDDLYPVATRWLCRTFHENLVAEKRSGLVVLDSRTKVKNVPNAVGVLTQRLKNSGDPFPRLLDSPVFGHSDLHVMLQIADVVVSGLVFPIACIAYSSQLTWNTHSDPRYNALRERYGSKLRDLQFRYQQVGEWRGGLYPTSELGLLSAKAMFHTSPPEDPRLPFIG